MIRRADDGDLKDMEAVWYEASVKDQAFVDRAYWDENREAVRTVYLPGAENWVVEEAGRVVAFCSLKGDRVAALFVQPGHQGRGLGGRLLNHVKALRGRLELSVYTENRSARKFYDRHGFRLVREETNAGTGLPELLLEWRPGGPERD